MLLDLNTKSQRGTKHLNAQLYIRKNKYSIFFRIPEASRYRLQYLWLFGLSESISRIQLLGLLILRATVGHIIYSVYHRMGRLISVAILWLS